MNIWLIAGTVVLIGGVLPATLLGMRGEPVARVVALQQLAVAVTLVLMLFAQAVDRSDYLIVALTLVVVSFAGTLVFARLLVPRDR